MAQEPVNSTNNINIANTVSLWFNHNFGTTDVSWKEFGDLYVDGVSVTPDWAEHRSYRNGRNTLRKRLLVAENCAINATLNEPNITNLQRVLYGGTINTSDSIKIYEGRHLELKSTGNVDGVAADVGEEYFDIETDTGEGTAGRTITLFAVYALTDPTEATNLLTKEVVQNTDGHAHIEDAGETDLTTGDTYYVKWYYTESNMHSTEIYGAQASTIEGAARLEARNSKGGSVQIWDIASAQLAPNGDIGYPLDGIQQVPLTMTLQEKSGTWGTIYTA